jgi:hypothetical protein
MSSLGDAIGRRTDGRDPVRAVPAVKPLPAPAHGAGGGEQRGDDRSELRRRRDALAEQVAELHWDLGGLTYEMAIRDHFRLDVLVRRAATLQERDAELAEVERLLRMEADGTAGSCPHCGAPHSRGASFCWQCGSGLIEQRGRPASGDDADTAVMDALLAQHVAPPLGEPPHRAREPEPGSGSDG